jgi:hypothetical protein
MARGGEQPEHGHDEGIAVDATLEDDIAQVVAAIDTFLLHQGVAQQQALRAALDHLNAQIDRSDAYHSSALAPSTYHGMTSMYQVFGETSRNPVVDQVPAPTLQAQVELVRAAKEVVRTPTPGALERIRVARQVLRDTEKSGS